MNVTFCGHSQITKEDKIASWLRTVTQSLIEQGATTFFLGGYGEFDSLTTLFMREQPGRKECFFMPKYKATAYIRLSYTDDHSSESDSVSNQRKLIENFVEHNPDIEVVSEKIDDGYSGIIFVEVR